MQREIATVAYEAAQGEKIAQTCVTRCESEELVGMTRQLGCGPTAQYAARTLDALRGGFWHGMWGGDDPLSGARNLADIDAVMEKGWAAGAEKALKLAATLAIPPAQSTRRRRRVGRDGTDVVVESWLERDYEHMFSFSHREASPGSRVIRVVCGWGGTSKRSGEDLFWSGAAALALTAALEAAGYGVELVAGYHSVPGSYDPKSNKAQVLLCAMKRSDQPLAPDTIAAVLAHGGVFRAYGLMSLSHLPWNFGPLLGSSRGIVPAYAALAAAGYVPAADVVIPNVYARAEALEVLQEAGKQFAGEGAGK